MFHRLPKIYKWINSTFSQSSALAREFRINFDRSMSPFWNCNTQSNFVIQTDS
jgi:hypothetical protein